MAKQTITINPSNWVSDSMELTFDLENMTFSFHGYDFVLANHQLDTSDEDFQFEHYDIFHVEENGERQEYRSGWVARSNWKQRGWSQWEACKGEEMQREDQDSPIIASAKLMANLY